MAPRKTRTAAADQAATAEKTVSDQGSAPLEPPTGDSAPLTPPAEPAPVEPAPVEQTEPVEPAPVEPGAPVEPAAGDDAGDELSGPAPAQAAPLEPPAPPAPLPVPPGPPVDMKMIATPGTEFENLVWSDGTPADPDEMFVDPGAQYTYVVVAREIQRRFYMPGARRTAGQILFPEGWQVAREHADRVKNDLRRLRQEQAAAKDS
ncbi:hypothetical protein ACGFJC_47395 [Nonomuraea fuscirosea]|uniref:hypothetical protein n=1 Tax=Nonomuraea fuscirosea TaxID=1291556 RepID=UPI00371B30F8